MFRGVRASGCFALVYSTFLTLSYTALHHTARYCTTLRSSGTMAQLNGSNGTGLLYKPRQYQYEMFEASLKENIIVAVCSSSVLTLWGCL